MECALEPPTTRTATRTHASQVTSAPANDRSTAVRLTRPVRRQHCREHLHFFRKMLVSLPSVRRATQRYLPLSRAHGILRRLLLIPRAQYRRQEPALRVRFSSARVQFRRREHALRAPFPSTLVQVLARGTRAFSAVLLSPGINSAMGARASSAASLNYGKGVCASRAASPSYAPRSNKTAAPSCRSTQRECSLPPLPDHVVAGGLRCGKANTKTPLPDHVVAVTSKVWDRQYQTPRSFARLDSVFPRDSSGRSILLPIKEESTRLATSSPFSMRRNGKDPSRVGLLLPPTRAPLLNLRGLQALIRLHAR